MSSVLLAELQKLVSAHGYWVVALIVGLESMGLPLPGETILVLAAIYAATEPSFNVGVVIAVAERETSRSAFALASPLRTFDHLSNSEAVREHQRVGAALGAAASRAAPGRDGGQA